MQGKYGNTFSIIWNVLGTAGRTPVGNGWVIFETQHNRSQALFTQPLLHAFQHQQLKVYWKTVMKKQQTRIRWAFGGFLFSKNTEQPSENKLPKMNGCQGNNLTDMWKSSTKMLTFLSLCCPCHLLKLS